MNEPIDQFDLGLYAHLLADSYVMSYAYGYASCV